MNNEEDSIDLQLQKLKQSILDVSQQKPNLTKEPYSFHKRLQQKMKNNLLVSFDSNKEIDILEAGEYLKLLCHQKKYLSERRADKIGQMNEQLHIQQEDFKYLFMVVTQANYFKLEYPGYYEKILQQVSNYPKSMFSSIEKDIHRTFQNQHPFQSSLRNILVAFAIRNPNLLYCQGMNYLVAYFLINSLSEEETFWILVCLVENVLPDDYFKDLSTISITTQIFADVLPYLFPDMGREMKNIGMDCSLFVVSWYVCLFTKGFINSVSAYLLTKLILQKRNHSFGFVLLKLSLGVIAAILGRDQPFAFRPEFSAFRDKFQLSVFEISLLEIKLGIEYVELNEQNFLKLQKHYQEKREERHAQTLEKDMRHKRFSLPICNTEYPICLHRLEIQRKLGNVSQVVITRNGYEMTSQYIEGYFDNQPKIESSCNVYETIEDCLMYRHKHICQLELAENADDLSLKLEGKVKLRHDESFMLERQKFEAMMECSSSVQMEIKKFVETDDQKFRELSGFFVVDEAFKFGSQEDLQEFELVQEDGSNALREGLHVRSASSLDETFSLAKQLERHHIEQDWIKYQDQFNTLQEQNINITPIKSNKVLQISQQLSEKKEQIGQRAFSANELSPLKIQKDSAFFSKQKIWNFLGKTWKKVNKIKQEQLKK